MTSNDEIRKPYTTGSPLIFRIKPIYSETGMDEKDFKILFNTFKNDLREGMSEIVIRDSLNTFRGSGDFTRNQLEQLHNAVNKAIKEEKVLKAKRE